MGKISKTKLLKKGKYTPDAKLGTTSAPADAEKKLSIEKKEKKSAKERLRMNRKARMLRAGITEEQIKECENKDNIRLLLCLTYGQFKFEDGKNKFTGAKAIAKAVEKKFNSKLCKVLKATGNYTWVSTNTEHAEEIATYMRQAGRTLIYSLKEHEEKETKCKKPTGNTNRAKAVAKAKRKKLNVDKHNMKPFYAAKRNGGVISKRIRMNNPKLAEKIEEWLKQFGELPKRSTTGSFRHKKRGTRPKTCLQTLAERRKMRAKKIGKLLIQKEEKKASEKLKMAKNAKKKAAEIAKKAAKKEQKLNLAA